MRTALRICFLAVFAAGCGQRPPVSEAGPGSFAEAPQAGQLSRDVPESPEAMVRRALNTPLPDGPHLAAQAYDVLFSDASEARLRELAQNRNLSIALQARWELRETDHPLPSDVAHPSHIPGFLEGDGGLRPPMSWSVHFAMSWYRGRPAWDQLTEFYSRTGYAGVKNEKFTFVDGKERFYRTVNVQPEMHRTSYGPLASKGVEITKDRNAVHIHVQSQSFRVDEDVFPRKGHSHDVNADGCIVAAALKADRAFVAISEDALASGSLMCIDLPSERVVWRSAVWGPHADASPPLSGPWYYDVQLVCDGDKVAVFGRGTAIPPYVESFDARTGENQLRFSSHYWDCRKGTSLTR